MSKKKRKDIQVKVDIDFTEYIGGIIDAPLEEFSTTIERDRVPVGVLLNTKALLVMMYGDLCDRKDAIMKMYKQGALEQEEVTDIFKKIYAELTKIEAKVLYLEERINKLLDVG